MIEYIIGQNNFNVLYVIIRIITINKSRTYAALFQKDSVHVLFGFVLTLMNICVVCVDLLTEARNVLRKELSVY